MLKDSFELFHLRTLLISVPSFREERGSVVLGNLSLHLSSPEIGLQPLVQMGNIARRQSILFN